MSEFVKVGVTKTEDRRVKIMLGVTIQLYDQRYCGFSNRVFVKVFAIRNLGVNKHLY